MTGRHSNRLQYEVLTLSNGGSEYLYHVLQVLRGDTYSAPPPGLAVMASTAEPENQIVLNIVDSYGCMVVGAWLSCTMWGVSCAQTFLYLSRYWDKDPWMKKGLPLWHVLIANFGNIPILSQIQPGLTHHAWVAGIVTFCVQLFFVHRIYKFSRCQWFIPAFLVRFAPLRDFFSSDFRIQGPSIAVPTEWVHDFPSVPYATDQNHLVVLISYDVLTVSGGSHTTSGIEKSWATDMLVSLRSVTAAEDIIITATMTFLVFKHGLPEFRATRRMIYRFILVTFNTGFWMAVAAIIELAMVARHPPGLQFMVPEGPLCSLYFCALLVNLNSREFVKGETFTSWNDWEVYGGGNSKPGHVDGEGRYYATQISDSDAREGSMDGMQYKYKPETQNVTVSPV
ncbi:hypothetical protein EVG20_g8919 [Dentipellis fragilis]|uniref:DUF6534 domain-containing protein n=1 Tax=Dentipellis fragilis TaxID=205917 RepID=A0A4Y9Y1X3_9AGAM|nr:hypothetical protein EVG20_g8919 [Dentipellis fragilis]